MSDKDEAKDSEGGVVVSSLDDFVINFMMFKFGHKNLVKTRLTSLINTVFALEASDKLIHTFGRFCGLIVR